MIVTSSWERLFISLGHSFEIFSVEGLKEPPTQTLLGIRHTFLSHERLKRATHSFPFVKKLSSGNHVRVTYKPISAV